MKDDDQCLIDPPDPFAPLDEWERFEQETLRSINPNWPTAKRLYACLQKRRDRESWFKKIQACERTDGDG
ncbi:hypothetical protein BAL199_07623 [alpha proteobacterium BAL199]|jgi:hypothetical protein|nr:hypothetical protein BAL199_07623 [alpha proteobacterium BAL199]